MGFEVGSLSDFTTRFSFVIKALDPTYFGDGIAFYISPVDSKIPANSSGGCLALFSESAATNSSANRIIAVEFDSFSNKWDPGWNHIGIDVNSIESVKYVPLDFPINDGSKAEVRISYNATNFNLRVFVAFGSGNWSRRRKSNLSYTIDLREYLPEMVRVGFSAATGANIEIHSLLSWSFNSTLEEGSVSLGESPSLSVERPMSPVGSVSAKGGKTRASSGVNVVVAVVIGLGVLASVSGTAWFVYQRKIRSRHGEEDAAIDLLIEFEKGTGPKRFTYRELSRATNGFAEGGKLGEGGFGGVYKGLLSKNGAEIAVKKISSGSKQGKKEYLSEVKIISRLRHRNLVQLIGWCHEGRELLLVYEFLPNGSLDGHLFCGKTELGWPVRYKIALGLASALFYLHEEWEQCVVHRDVKSSNVMLDSNFNAKLGDFGLARLVDHGQGSQTTVLAGTMGYLAPECVTTGKASKESDVYSFGVVALEIACGRRPVDPTEGDPSKVRLVEWVWSLYGKGNLLDAVDKSLNTEYEERQVECLMVVGLWCCHPDYTLRPSIRQVLNVLNFEAPLPNLPPKLPVPTYYLPPLEFPITVTSYGLYSSRTQSSSGTASYTSSTATSSPSSKALLSGSKDI